MEYDKLEKIIIISGGGTYPQMLIAGAREAGVGRVDVLAVRGSTTRATRKAADRVHTIGIGEVAEGLKWVAAQGYDGCILAGQISPASLFTTRFDAQTKAWLAELPCKTAHSVYGKLTEEFEKAGVRVLPASLYMGRHLPGEGTLTERGFTERERRDAEHGKAVMSDMGRHDVGQTVLVKEGMVLAVEAFEGTNACIRRAGKLGGKGSVMVKGAREGHDMRFDIPVAGLKTLKTMHRAGVKALAFQAGRLILLEREATIEYANRKGIAVAGFDSGLPPAPTINNQ